METSPSSSTPTSTSTSTPTSPQLSVTKTKKKAAKPKTTTKKHAKPTTTKTRAKPTTTKTRAKPTTTNTRAKPTTTKTRAKPTTTKTRAKPTTTKTCAPQKPTKARTNHQQKNNTFDWKATKDFVSPNLNKDFLEVSGPSRNVPKDGSPADIFSLFFSNGILETIARETNRYHKAMGGSNNKERYTRWKDVTTDEIRAFLGVLLAMGMTKISETRDYWRKTSFSHVPWFGSVFTRGRFQDILDSLHLVNNENHEDDPNKLFKLGDLPSKINENFYNHYTPERELAIDEQMIGTKCRVSFIQYMPQKPCRFGIKVWALCESTSGYCLKFQIYKGKEGNAEQGLGHRVVMDLMEPYQFQNRHLYMDNFYTSPKLFSDLAEMQTYACGTIRKNRGQFPESFKDKKLARGESVYISDDNLLAVHWFDKRDVFVLSSIQNTGNVEVCRRGSDEPFSKPLPIHEYNKFMGGVDHCDQLISNYAIKRRSKKWWKKVFYRLLELSVINAYVIFAKLNPEYTSHRFHRYFREALIHELVQPLLDARCDPNNLAEKERIGRPANIDYVRLRGKHFSVSRYPTRKTCTGCGYKKNGRTGKQSRKKTYNYCVKCDLPICKECFERFHTKSQV